MPLKGADEAIKNTDKWTRENWDKIGVAWRDEMAKIVGEATELCPVKTGRLRATIPNVSRVEITPNRLTGIIGCGTDYGVYVHEAIVSSTGRPIYHNPPTQAKFIEVPVLRNAPEIPGRIRDKVK